jgi:transcriptional regulator with XRE-family HTH domain
MNDLASRLIQLRALAGGISQRELARLAGTSSAYPGMIERATLDTPVSGALATRLAQVFGCSLDYLLNGLGEPPSERVVKAAVALAFTKAEEREVRALGVRHQRRRGRKTAAVGQAPKPKPPQQPPPKPIRLPKPVPAPAAVPPRPKPRPVPLPATGKTSRARRASEPPRTPIASSRRA